MFSFSGFSLAALLALHSAAGALVTPTKNYDLICTEDPPETVTVSPTTAPTATPRAGSPSKTLSPEKTIEPPNTKKVVPPGPPPEEGERAAGVWGDPHLTTWDGLKYDCQARGDHVYARSLESDFEIQGRFGRPDHINKLLSWSTGVTVKEGTEEVPVIEISLPNPWESCEVDFIVDGVKQDPAAGIPDTLWVNSTVKEDGKSIVVEYWNGLAIKATERARSHFGCSLTLNVRMPYSFRNDETIVGLWGTPNGDQTDDWMELDGTNIPLATYGRKGRQGYTYCVRWCLTNETNSLFTYGDATGTSFEDVTDCKIIPEVPLGDDDEFADFLDDAPADIIAACANHADKQDCILDAMMGDDPAEILLNELDAIANGQKQMKWTACGDRTRQDCAMKYGEDELLAFLTQDDLEIACCSDATTKPAVHDEWVKNEGSDVWGTQLSGGVGECKKGNYNTAVDECAQAGGRLCTREEVFDGAVAGGTCGYDGELVWTDSSPSSDLEFLQWAACGSGQNGRCDGEEHGRPAKLADPTELHEVRCCADEAKNGWSDNGCPGEVWAATNFGGACFDSEDLASADQICTLAGGRLCTVEEITKGCTTGTGCGFDANFVWTATPGYAEKHVDKTAAIADALDAADKYWLACGDRTKADCEKVEGANEIAAAVTEEHEVRCCAESDPGTDGWVTTCDGIWAHSPGCVVETYDEAKQTCSDAGGRLCTLEEVSDLCTVGSGCGFEKDLVWTATAVDPSVLEEEPMNWLSCGRLNNCQELNGVGAVLAKHDEFHEVRCCADTWHKDWKQNTDLGCEIWAQSELNGICYHAETLASAREICAKEDARLCTKEELMSGCTSGSGCNHDYDLIWSDTRGWKEKEVEVEDTYDTDTKYWLACGNSDPAKCVRMTGADTMIAAETELHEVRCCADSDLDGADEIWSQPAGCSVWGASYFSDECYDAKTYQEASDICTNNNARLCTKEEVESCTTSSDCSHDSNLVWTSEEVTEAVVNKRWISCGAVGRCGAVGAMMVDRDETADADLSITHEVRCCSENYHTAWKRNAGCDVYGGSNVPTCIHSNTYQQAEETCARVGARLCSKEELQNDCTRGSGCSHDVDYIWTLSKAWDVAV